MSDQDVTTIKSPLGKFLIGAIAGTAAIALPKIVATLSSQSALESAQYVSMLFVWVSILFAIILGVIVALFEYQIPKPPKETFFAALAIPAVVAGSLNTAIESGAANQYYLDAVALTEELAEAVELREEPLNSEIREIEIFQSQEAPASEETLSNSFGFRISLFPTAYAQESVASEQSTFTKSTANRPSSKLSIARDNSLYAVSLGTFNTQDAAISKARQLAKSVPEVSLIQSGKQYEILMSKNFLTKSAATLEVVKLKKEIPAIAPKLLSVGF